MSARTTTAWTAAGLLAGGAAIGAAVSQLGVTGAASPTPKPNSSVAPARPFPHPGQGFGHRGPGHGGGLAGLGRVLHGQATVQAPTGGTKVMSLQTGAITAISGSQVTVKSTDGFTTTYTVDKDTRIVLRGTQGALSSLKSGDTVPVLAVKSGSSWTAKAVRVGDLRKAGAPAGGGTTSG